MSGPLKMTPGELGRLARFLEGLTELRRDTGWELACPAAVELIDPTMGCSQVGISIDLDLDTYTVDDRVGG